MPAFVILMAMTLASAFGSAAPKDCYWETRHAPKCVAFSAWVKAGPHPRGERFIWRGSNALPGALPEVP